MPLYIANSEADALARELAEFTGETITDAVLVALRERLRRVREPDISVRLTRALAIADRAAAVIAKRTTKVSEDLYDENGLPI